MMIFADHPARTLLLHLVYTVEEGYVDPPAWVSLALGWPLD